MPDVKCECTYACSVSSGSKKPQKLIAQIANCKFSSAVRQSRSPGRARPAACALSRHWEPMLANSWSWAKDWPSLQVSCVGHQNQSLYMRNDQWICTPEVPICSWVVDHRLNLYGWMDFSHKLHRVSTGACGAWTRSWAQVLTTTPPGTHTTLLAATHTPA